MPFTSLIKGNYSGKNFLFTELIMVITETEYIKILIKYNSRSLIYRFTFFLCLSLGAFPLLLKVYGYQAYQLGRGK